MASDKERRDPKIVSATMRQVKGRDTAPEIRLRRALHAAGYRFRVHCHKLTGKPDIVMAGRRTVVFVDGDLWHGNQWRLRGHGSLEEQYASISNREYWIRKLTRNIDRDLQVTRDLQSEGWTVVRLWESDVNTNLARCVDAVMRANEDQAAQRRAQVAAQTVSEFFAGIGLMRLGLARAGWHTIWANDIDAKKQQMYLSNFSAKEFVLADVHSIRGAGVPRSTLATASFPCNDLSLAGGRKGLCGANSSAFWGFARVLREMGPQRPVFVLLENVPGLLSSHAGNDLAEILGALADLGYAVDCFVINAARFVPQSRERLFVLGRQQWTLAGSSVGVALAAESEHRPRALLDFIHRHPTLPWAIEPLPSLPSCERNIAAVIESLPADDEMWWSPERTAYLVSQTSPRHREALETLRRSPGAHFATAFRRVRDGKTVAELRFDGVAGCLRTPRGGSGRQILLQAGDGAVRVRLLSPRECARLMGADDFLIDVPTNQALFGFGDAVVVPVIQWIAQHYLTRAASAALRLLPPDESPYVAASVSCAV